LQLSDLHNSAAISVDSKLVIRRLTIVMTEKRLELSDLTKPSENRYYCTWCKVWVGKSHYFDCRKLHGGNDSQPSQEDLAAALKGEQRTARAAKRTCRGNEHSAAQMLETAVIEKMPEDGDPIGLHEPARWFQAQAY
jgi:hypothetical protein